MQLTQHADHLVLSYPWWIGTGLLIAATILLTCAAFGARALRRRWTATAAGAVSIWAGLYFTTFTAVITQESGSVHTFPRHEQTVNWKDATDIYLERSGGEWHIVIVDALKRKLEFNVADLPISDRDRVMAYMVDRMPETAFPRSPGLMKRHAPGASRPVGFFSDQQT